MPSASALRGAQRMCYTFHHIKPQQNVRSKEERVNASQ